MKDISFHWKYQMDADMFKYSVSQKHKYSQYSAIKNKEI